MRIAVVDGQGGGIGKAIVEKIREALGDRDEIIALGTNALATSQMLKAGANVGASGENAIIYNVDRVDVVVGSVAILAKNAMMGEISPAIAGAIGECAARKLLIPLNKCNITIAGAAAVPLPHYINDVVEILKRIKEA